MMLAARMRASLAATVDDHVPYTSDMRERRHSTGTAAAVLIAITDRPDPGVILTQRPETMRRHAGQVAFPGGRIDPDDSDAVAAALREAYEEIALLPSCVHIIGPLPLYQTVTGFDITPVLAVIPPDLSLVPHPCEVAAVFEVPLRYVFDSANRTEQAMTIDGIDRHYFEIQWNERKIWGATAAMLANLSARLQW